MTQRASITVPAPADDLFDWLRDVRAWPDFLEGLDGVQELGYHRWRWTVTFGGHTDTCDVVVSTDSHGRRITWKHLSGRPFDGSFQLSPLDGRTVVDLAVDVKPVGLAEGITDFTRHDSWMAEADARRLHDAVEEWVALRRSGGDVPTREDGEAVG